MLPTCTYLLNSGLCRAATDALMLFQRSCISQHLMATWAAQAAILRSQPLQMHLQLTCGIKDAATGIADDSIACRWPSRIRTDPTKGVHVCWLRRVRTRRVRLQFLCTVERGATRFA